MNRISDIELIERHLDNELNDSEIQNFEIRLNSDPEFLKELNLHKEIRMALSDIEVIELRNKLNNLRLMHKRKHRNKKYYLLSFLSACSILVFVIILTNNVSFNSTNNDDLYNEYYQHIVYHDFKRGKADIDSSTLRKALYAYDSLNYNKAIKLFQEINDSSEYICCKEFFMGLSYMEIHNFNQAISHLEVVSQCGQSLYSEDAIWYIGLCNLKLNNKEKAIDYFEKLLISDAYNQKRAKEILDRIKELN